MIPKLLFSAGSGLALVSWLALAIALFAASIRPWVWRATGIAVPAVLGFAYLGMLPGGLAATPDGGFGSIGEVRALFANDAMLTAGWLHYLAFDLFVGTWIARTGLDIGVPRIVLLPCLLLTFLFGPVGFLLFLAARLFAQQRART